MVDDEDIDNESLQAQIDLSMAYLHDMVSSWVKKPSLGNLHKSTSRDIEKEIQDQLRQPPRLGVGAKVSQAAAMASRDTERLRNDLVKVNGKKRVRERPDISHHDDDDEDEAESRTRAIQSKPGKHRDAVKDLLLRSTIETSLLRSPTSVHRDRDITSGKKSTETNSEPIPRKKRRKKKKKLRHAGDTALPVSPSPSQSPNIANNTIHRQL